MRTFMLTGVTCLALIALTAGAIAAETKIGYVDMQRALLEVEEGRVAKSKLDEMKTKRQAELDAKQNELRELQKNLEAQKEFMQDDVRRQKEDEFRTRLGELQVTYQQLQKELAIEEAKLTKGILDRMIRILATMGKDGEFTVILEKTESSILWAPAHLDLTNELIRHFNDGTGGGAKKKKAKK